MKQIIAAVRPNPPLPPDTFDVLLADPQTYCFVESPIAPERWEELRGEMHWTVFTTIEQMATDHPDWDTARIAKEFRAIAGFDQFDTLLKRHFLRRGSFLRCSRIVHDALKIRDEVRFTQLDKFRVLDQENRAKQDRLLSLIQRRREDDPT